MKYLRLPVLALLALATSQAHAIPVTYSMTGNGVYDNPVGTFTYDATSNVYTNVNIWSLDHYTSAVGNAADTLLRATGVMRSVLELSFSSALTDAGGNLTFSGYERGILTMFGRVTRTGSVDSGGSVPEPGAALLLLLGLAGAAFLPRRMAAKTR